MNCPNCGEEYFEDDAINGGSQSISADGEEVIIDIRFECPKCNAEYFLNLNIDWDDLTENLNMVEMNDEEEE